MLKEAFDLVGPEPELLVRALRERFTRLALDEVLGEHEKSVQVGCIGELILGLGGKESAASDKRQALLYSFDQGRRGGLAHAVCD